MAKPHSKAQPKKDQHTITQRYYTVGYVPQRGRPNPRPSITIKGRWLEQLGFTTGMPVTVTIDDGRLIITPEIRI